MEICSIISAKNYITNIIFVPQNSILRELIGYGVTNSSKPVVIDYIARKYTYLPISDLCR